MQCVDLGIEARIPVAAAIVILNYVFKGGESAVVHVGRRARDLAQRGRFEGAPVFGLPGHSEVAVILKAPVAPGDARVVKTLVR